MNHCEWNPAENRPARTDEPAHAEAVIAVGAGGAYHLCGACAALPVFSKYRVRVLLKRAKGGV